MIIKKYKKFFEDDGGGDAYADSSISGMGDVVSSQPGQLPGTTGTDGSGDVFFGFKRGKRRRRKKGNPSEVSDLRDLKSVKINRIKDF